jgi:hypothetical protein
MAKVDTNMCCVQLPAPNGAAQPHPIRRTFVKRDRTSRIDVRANARPPAHRCRTGVITRPIWPWRLASRMPRGSRIDPLPSAMAASELTACLGDDNRLG